MTEEEIQRVEDAEYRESIRKLLDDPAFIRILTRWRVDTMNARTGPILRESIEIENYTSGRASLVEEMFAGISAAYPAAYQQIQQEVTNYVRRRESVGSDDRDDSDE